ncbi:MULTISPECIES: D-glycero-alpha-D-manno-heptose-1,7-bisphosphate 7-phosphatase [unclassified Prochlorococcus]|uniref:D-glycero-alpha-D-manno-heptose-1,7-bisphosphate 7-phosphatase n=1 Tax=unclassified Prochlorococcus TaxID=2627481 RepID=UPI0005337F9B|nr:MULTISPECIES: HAD-IIIA family hydrolase [unclassified Prochlorococcus]KGG16352.1 putative D,D-heptose 1,7-bisphosphate phosphatasee (D-glycero-D-manno-heptose 1,7-bisphosphate phosphatasee) [Prochlorococcus sp. MIT 0603]KGG17914.1 putative D,D-heptose 1,7-bisphosphate phosphatasee (D-glycero-D-manno-heptose 1,7-bisphosphate phosphatasee) [Prochlorococcus sp. MIT 0602]
MLLDRDGTINIDEDGYSHDYNKCILFDDVYEFFTRINYNIKVCVVTNQSGIGRGLFSLNQMNEFNNKINSLIRKNSDHPGIDKFFYCPHKPIDLCNCRKPKTGLIEKALNYYQCNSENSILIGDKTTDLLAGKGCGVKSYLLKRGVNGQNNIHENNYISSLLDPSLEFLFY